MKVVVKEFYPSEPGGKSAILGTLRVEVIDLGLELLGVVVTRKGDKWHFMLPGRRETNHEGKAVRYPFVSLTDKQKHKALVHAIGIEGVAFFGKNPIKEASLDPQPVPGKARRGSKFAAVKK